MKKYSHNKYKQEKFVSPGLLAYRELRPCKWVCSHKMSFCVYDLIRRALISLVQTLKLKTSGVPNLMLYSRLKKNSVLN